MAVLNAIRNNYGLLAKTDEQMNSTDWEPNSQWTDAGDTTDNRYIHAHIHVMKTELLHAQNIIAVKVSAFRTGSETNGCDYVAKTEICTLFPRAVSTDPFVSFTMDLPTWSVSMRRYEFTRRVLFFYDTGYHLTRHKYGPMQGCSHICMFCASHKSYI